MVFSLALLFTGDLSRPSLCDGWDMFQQTPATVSAGKRGIKNGWMVSGLKLSKFYCYFSRAVTRSKVTLYMYSRMLVIIYTLDFLLTRD